MVNEMNNLRSEFEKFPEIKKLIDEGEAFYCDKGDWYLCKDIDNSEIELALDAAWHTFKEQQKKIDEIDKHFQSLISESELWGFSSDQATRQIELIQELLK